MIKKVQKFSAIIAVSTMLSSSALASDATVALGVNLATTGFGLEARAPIAENIFGRIGVNYAKFTRNLNKHETKGSLSLTLLSTPVMIDWHPFDESGFRLSAGIAYNGNEISGKSNIVESTTVNGVRYSSAEVGNVKFKINLGSKFAGIASFGYDSSFISEDAFSFNCEFGVMYSGKGKLSVNATGTKSDAYEYNYKKDDSKEFTKIAKYLGIYPIIKVGVKYAL